MKKIIFLIVLGILVQCSKETSNPVTLNIPSPSDEDTSLQDQMPVAATPDPLPDNPPDGDMEQQVVEPAPEPPVAAQAEQQAGGNPQVNPVQTPPSIQTSPNNQSAADANQRTLQLLPLPDNAVAQTVDSMNVPAGQTQRIVADRVIARNGFLLEGNLVFELPAGSTADRVEIVVEQGDVVLGGQISLQPAVPVVWWMKALQKLPQFFIPDALAQVIVITNSAPWGRSIRLVAANGNLILRSNFVAQAENGSNAPDVNVGNLNNLPQAGAQGQHGGGGGSIILEAPNGFIDFAPLVAPGGPRFTLGNGGRGSGLRVWPQDFPPRLQTSQTVRLTAGNGGQSGDLWLIARELRYSAATVRSVYLVDVQGGNGGGGGLVSWDRTSARAETNFLRVEIQTGHGGPGRLRGGIGGALFFDGGVQAIPGGRASPALVARSGDGGDIMPFQVPRVFQTIENQAFNGIDKIIFSTISEGGNGGWTRIRGNPGTPGNSAPSTQRNGGHAGDVDLTLGKGGSVLGDWDYFLSSETNNLVGGRGGHGGNGGQHERVETRNGGDGAPGCGDPEVMNRFGGNGGNGGGIVIRGGDGGNGFVPGNGSNIEFEQFGVVNIIVGNGGRGASGQSFENRTASTGAAGSAGRFDALRSSVGSGGFGSNALNQGTPNRRGQNGQILGTQPVGRMGEVDRCCGDRCCTGLNCPVI